MTKSAQAVVMLSLALLATACALLCAGVSRASAVPPLPASDYATRSVCGSPVPGRAHCLGSELVPETAAARERNHPLGMTRARAISAGAAGEGAYGLRPQDLRSVYFPGKEPDAPASEPQTIALVDTYNDPNAEAGLACRMTENLTFPNAPAPTDASARSTRMVKPASRRFPKIRRRSWPQKRSVKRVRARRRLDRRPAWKLKKYTLGHSRARATSSSPTRSVRTATSSGGGILA